MWRRRTFNYNDITVLSLLNPQRGRRAPSRSRPQRRSRAPSPPLSCARGRHPHHPTPSRGGARPPALTRLSGAPVCALEINTTPPTHSHHLTNRYTPPHRQIHTTPQPTPARGAARAPLPLALSPLDAEVSLEGLEAITAPLWIGEGSSLTARLLIGGVRASEHHMILSVIIL
jgi:hypothetical protein